MEYWLDVVGVLGARTSANIKFDFSGGYDDRSQRRQGLAELISRGYEDAYHQFIEPVVGASGEDVTFQNSDFRFSVPSSKFQVPSSKF